MKYQFIIIYHLWSEVIDKGFIFTSQQMLFGQVNSFRISLRKFDALGQRFIKLLQIIFDLQNKISSKSEREGSCDLSTPSKLREG